MAVGAPLGEHPPARRSSGDDAAQLIRTMIFDGRLRPGDRVPQDDVAAALGISRIPVREALIALEREGWVTIELHRGAFVASLDRASVRDNYELFGVVYGLAARRAIERGAEGLVVRLAALRAELDGARDPVSFGTLASAFHAAVVEAARSPRIKVVLRAMSALVPGHFFAVVPDAVAVERRGFTALLRAFRSGDADAAAAEYLHAMRRVGEKVAAVFAERGLFETAVARSASPIVSASRR
jgi:DNA-binding GntR family transcriptional regulator